MYETAQTKYCSLSVTGNNEVFIRKPNAENLLRIHSNIVEDLRYFHFYTASEVFVGSLACDVRQCFKLPAKLENVITGESFNISVQRQGNTKSWSVIPESKATSGAGDPVARIDAQIGHRWKSFYTLTFLDAKSGETSQVLILGFLLSLAFARLESELLPVILAVSAFLFTFVIFFIIQFT